MSSISPRRGPCEWLLSTWSTPSRFLTQRFENTAGHSLTDSQLVTESFDVSRVEHARFHRRRVGIVGVGVPAPNSRSSSPASGTKSLMSGFPVGPLAETDVGHLGQ